MLLSLLLLRVFVGSPPPSSSSSFSSATTEEDGPCLTALRVLLGDMGGDQNNGNRCSSRWLLSTRELRLVSFNLCNACRSVLPFRVWISQKTPRSLWASKSQQEKHDGGKEGGPCLVGTPISSKSINDRGSTPRRRMFSGVRATTIVWDRPAGEISSGQHFLENVAHLKFGFHFNEPLVLKKTARFRWPGTLVALDLGVKFHQDLSGVSLPSSLLELRFGAVFNRSIQGVAWPSRLVRLTFGASFNKPIIGIRWPTTLKHLEFGVNFDQPLVQDTATTTAAADSVFWPPLLESLMFGTDFSHTVGGGGSTLPVAEAEGYSGNCSCGGGLPPSLKRLTLSQGFWQPIDTVAWPQGLEELNLDCLYVSVAGEGRLPTGLKRLRMDLNFHQSIRDVMPLLPITLEEVTFGSNFNQPVGGVEWPLGLKKVAFGASFNQPVEDDSIRFPPHLEELQFGFRFNQPIAGVAWPASLRHLTFQDHFNQPIAAVCWPEGLQELRFGRVFDKPFSSGGQAVRWPTRLCKLAIGKNFNQPVQGLCLPPGLVELELGEGCQQPLEGVRRPARLRMITVGRGWRGGGAVLASGGGLALPEGCRFRRR